MWLKHRNVPGPAEKPLQVSGLWEIKESQCQSQYSCWHWESACRRLGCLNVSIYLPHGGVIWIKRQWLWNPENKKLYANAQQSISGYVQDNSSENFPEKGDRPQLWKRHSYGTDQPCWICFDSLKLTIGRYPRKGTAFQKLLHSYAKHSFGNL